MTYPHVDPLLYVIILAFNDRKAILRCLASAQDLDYPNDHLLVVDNASADDTVSAVRQAYPSCEIIINEENLGFAAGCNVGMAHALNQGADFILLLNQDTLAAPDLLTVLVETAYQKPTAGIIAPKTYFLEPMPDGRPRLLYAGSWRFRLPLEQRLPGIGQADSGQYDTPTPVDYAWGHGMLLRAEMLRTIGLFDPAFFMYYEDMDLCRRARAAGYEVWYEPRTHMWHDTPDGARANASQSWRWRYKVNSLRVFYRKHYGRLRGWILTALHVLNEGRQLWCSGHHRAARHVVSHWLRAIRPIAGDTCTERSPSACTERSRSEGNH
jgi:GT2 family glycosyltransferase